MMHRFPSLCALLLLACASTANAVCILGPDDMPRQLCGVWKISLCGSDYHNWMRYQNVETGVVHTVGRYGKGFGGATDPCTGCETWPSAPVCGVIWDIDLKYEPAVRRGEHVLRSCYVRNPFIHRGGLDGHGHCGLRLNCTTHVRDAWHCYTGEYLCLPPLHTPHALERSLERSQERTSCEKLRRPSSLTEPPEGHRSSAAP